MRQSCLPKKSLAPRKIIYDRNHSSDPVLGQWLLTTVISLSKDDKQEYEWFD